MWSIDQLDRSVFETNETTETEEHSFVAHLLDAIGGLVFVICLNVKRISDYVRCHSREIVAEIPSSINETSYNNLASLLDPERCMVPLVLLRNNRKYFLQIFDADRARVTPCAYNIFSCKV